MDFIGPPVALIELQPHLRRRAPNWPRCGWLKVAAQMGPWEEFPSRLVLGVFHRRRDVISWGYVLSVGPERTSETGYDPRPTDYRGEFIVSPSGLADGSRS